MKRIDTHQHFWKYSAEQYPWIAPQREPLNRDYLPEDAWPLMQGAGVDGAIAVEARAGDIENQWLLALARQHPFIVGVVGRIDLSDAAARERMTEYARNPQYCGVRVPMQMESKDPVRFQPEFLKGMSLLEENNLTFDLLVTSPDLAAASALAERFSEVRFIVDHLAKPRIREKIMQPWQEGIERLAELPNVYCKMSGMITEADRSAWTQEDFSPYFDAIFSAFGHERILFGSDWPVSKQAATYKQTVEVVENYVMNLSEEAQRNVWHETAERVYQYSA